MTTSFRGRFRGSRCLGLCSAAHVVFHHSVPDVNGAIGEGGDVRLVRDEDDGVAGFVEALEDAHDLEASLGVPVWSLAYPFGGTDSVSLRELQMAERAGYDCAFVNFGGGFGPRTSRFGIPRLHVTLEMNLAEFEGHLCGLHECLRRYVGHVEELPSGPNGAQGGRDA